MIGTLLLASLSCCGESASGAAPAAGATAANRGKVEAPQASGPGKLSTIDRSHAGSPAPAVMFEQRGGKATSVAAFKGHVVLVNIWATWCVPCVAEMPELDRLAALRGTRTTILPISADLEGWRAVDKFFKPGRFPHLAPYLDQPGAYPVKLDATGLPLSILYGPDGRERWRVNGPLKWTSPAVVSALN